MSFKLQNRTVFLGFKVENRTGKFTLFFDLKFKSGLVFREKMNSRSRGVGSVGNSERVIQAGVGKSLIFPPLRHFPHPIPSLFSGIGSSPPFIHTVFPPPIEGRDTRMGEHLRKRFDEEFVQSILQKYAAKQLSVEQAVGILGIHRSQFFALLSQWKANNGHVTLASRRPAGMRIDASLEALIVEELAKEKRLIDDAEIPVYTYNYSYVRDQIFKALGRTVSVPTIIKRAKQNNNYLPKKVRTVHDREVLTHYPGELIQHDSSVHRFSPYAEKKWYLITSVDDFSRFMLYAQLVERESSWAHISALESAILAFGIPLAYYVDCHSIFRFVQGRDSVWREHKKLTDQVTPQWKQVLQDLRVKVTYALSPQAKGKVERPYRWLQDRLVRTCARENIKTIDEAQKVLSYEVDRYNHKQVHSTTKEIPAIRFDKALAFQRTMFRPFKLPSPYESTKDIFCLRLEKTVDAYHNVHLNGFPLRVRDVPLREKVDIRIVPDEKNGISELRFWYHRKLIDVKRVKNIDLEGVQF